MRKHNLQIFVPVNLPCGLPAAPVALESAIIALCELGGGVTVTEAQGIWSDPRTGHIVREPVRIVETDAPGAGSILLEELRTLARCIAHDLDQDAVYIRIRESDSYEITKGSN